MAVAAVEPQFWRNALSVLGLPDDLAERQMERSSWKHQIDQVSRRFSTRTRAQWEVAFDTVDACVTPVLTPQEARSHPQVQQYYQSDGQVMRPKAAPMFRPFAWPEG